MNFNASDCRIDIVDNPIRPYTNFICTLVFPLHRGTDKRAFLQKVKNANDALVPWLRNPLEILFGTVAHPYSKSFHRV